MNLTDLCEVLRNWFDVDRHIGNFEIENGTIDLDYLVEGQFYRIVGSIQNDGVVYCNEGKLYHIIGVDDEGNYEMVACTDETFNGAVWVLALPPNFLQTYLTMCEWENKNKEALSGAYASESFGGYSYSLGTSGGEGLSWQNHFKKDLERWQKI